ncbi:MAG: choice-of-anchor V domain-containing protein [Pyrinomonadaceae bacterium]
MRKIRIACVAGAVVLMALAIAMMDNPRFSAKASIDGPPSRRTGAPGEQNCTACHAQSTGSGEFSIIAPSTYTPGQTYSIQVKHLTTDTTRKRWGFELTSVANNVMAGSFANVNATTKIVSGTVGSSSRSYIEHTTSGTFANQTGGATWSFNWTAPSTDVGPVTLYAAGIQGNNNGNEDGDRMYLSNLTIQPFQPVAVHHVFSDFDGDGKSDESVFRASNGTWYINGSTSGFSVVQLGSSGDSLVPADFDGDDKADYAVWRSGDPDIAGFYILQSSDLTLRIERFGQTGDDPTVVGDWDGDGKADPAVYRDSASGNQSYFYYRGSNANPNGNITYLPWGTTGDKPLRGDFDGDQKTDLVVFRPSNSSWYIRESSTSQLRVERWGLPTDKFIPADYDGDGKTDPAVFRNGIWYVKRSSDSQVSYYFWGLGTDTLVLGDFDGDAKADPAVFRNGLWYVLRSSDNGMSVKSFGLANDDAIPGAFVN